MKKLLYILTLFLIVSCKKEKLPELPTSNSPVFKIEGTIDGQSISVIAGDDDYFMHSKEFMFNSVTQWQGSLSNGANAFEITLSDGIIDVPNSSYDLTQLNYLSITEMPNTPLLVLDKTNLSNGEFIQSIKWIVNDEVHTTQGPLVIYEPGKHTICAEVTFNNQSQAINCSEVILGYDKNAKGALKYVIGQNNTLVAFFDTPEYEIDYVEWFINDSMVSTNKVNLSTDLSANSCHLKAIVHYANGVIRTRSAFVNKAYPQHYIQDLTAFEDQNSMSWDFKLRMNISYNGQNYKGITTTTTDTQLHIQSIQEYGYNASGEKVLLVKGTLNAPMFHIESETVVNANLTLSFALPYK
jgi:hypothetical protein